MRKQLAQFILGKLGRWAGYKAAPGYGPIMSSTSVELVRTFGHATHSGKSITEDSATRISAAWCCLRILTETIGSLPWGIYTEDDKGNARKLKDHDLAVLLASPNVDQTSTEYREQKALNLAGSGNAYSWIDRLGERIVSLTPLRTAHVRPMRKVGTNTRLGIREGELFYRIGDRGRTEDHTRDKIWHVKLFGWDGLEGLSPIGAAREAMGGALASEEFGNRFFSQGAKPSGTVSYPGWLNEDQRRATRDNLQNLLGGLGNAHKIALFEGGMKPEAWGDMSLEDMQLLELRQFSVVEICRFFRIPPHMVADLSRATFSNIEHLSQEFVMFSLMPYLTRFESSFSKWLIPPSERGKIFLRFNVEGLLRADSKGRAEFYASALQNGWMSRNEVRAKENLNQAAGLDEYTVQSNMTDVGKLAAALAATSKAEKPRKAVLDHNGNPVGSMPVDDIHDIFTAED